MAVMLSRVAAAMRLSCPASAPSRAASSARKPSEEAPKINRELLELLRKPPTPPPLPDFLRNDKELRVRVEYVKVSHQHEQHQKFWEKMSLPGGVFALGSIGWR